MVDSTSQANGFPALNNPLGGSHEALDESSHSASGIRSSSESDSQNDCTHSRQH